MLLQTSTSIDPSEDARIGPYVGAMTTSLTQRVVHMGRSPLLEQRQQFVLRAIEAAHSGVGRRPDDKIDGKQAKLGGCCMDDWQSRTPIDEGSKDTPIGQMGQQPPDPASVEIEKLSICHLTGRHYKFAVIAADGVTAD